MSMFRYYDIGYSEVFIFDEFLVNQIKEGTTIVPKHNEKLKEVIDEHFKNRPVVYISNRVFSYSVDPITYVETSKIHNLLAMAMVSDSVEKRQSAAFERSFYSKPFEIFETLSEAIEWLHKVVQEELD